MIQPTVATRLRLIKDLIKTISSVWQLSEFSKDKCITSTAIRSGRDCSLWFRAPCGQKSRYSPAVRIGDQIIISGIVGADAEGRLPPDFRSQAENIFTTLEAILNEAGATLDDVASLNSYHVGDIHTQLREFVDIKATRIRPSHPTWTGVGVTQLGVPGALLEISAVAVARDQDVGT